MKATRGIGSVFMSIAIAALLSAGCADETDRGANNAERTSPDAVTLRMVHWFGTEAGPVVSEINERFHREYPNISVEVEYAPVDQYQSIIRSRFVAGGAPDLLGVFPGKWQEPFAEAGFLMDLSGSDWADRLKPDARNTMTTGGKLYAMPVNRNAIGVLYDKGFFERTGLDIPRTWNEFLSLCETIKRKGRVPIALGLKDQWVTQIIPYAMAPSAIYRDHPDFDARMYAGKASFSDSPWRAMLEDYARLEKNGYFNEGFLGTTYDQMVQMLATGKAAMMVMGNWSLGPILLTNPNAEIGMFPLPYGDADKPYWVSSGVSIGIGVSRTTPYPEEAKKYLAFWSRPEVNTLFLEGTKSFSVYRDVNPALDPALAEIEPAIRAGTYPFLDQNWPPGMQDKLFQVLQNWMAGGGKYSVGKALSELDKTFEETKTNHDWVP
ncbi:ABC transporter substrate-binding protein [Cohnella suwonensis]|uniref:ABC transporter substrate-binding protein n=1 Tax=Cohnella suwonensis TaxID=696072 RepID=A0ABW0LRP7_9BACL